MFKRIIFAVLSVTIAFSCQSVLFACAENDDLYIDNDTIVSKSGREIDKSQYRIHKAKIQKRIDAAPKTNVFINFGSISGISGLRNVGPQFDIELETAGRIISNVRTEFENVGINQTIHRIFLDLNTDIGIFEGNEFVYVNNG